MGGLMEVHLTFPPIVLSAMSTGHRFLHSEAACHAPVITRGVIAFTVVLGSVSISSLDGSDLASSR